MAADLVEKVCSGCGLVRPHRRPAPPKTKRKLPSPGRTLSTCNDCQKAYAKRWRRESGWQKAKIRNTYRGMVRRCQDPASERYRNAKTIPVWGDYGRIGITVCRRWLGPRGYERFVLDMGLPPSKEHQLDRKRNDRGYSPGNCRWATKAEQDANRKNTVWIEAVDPASGQVVTDSIAAHARRYKLEPSLVRNRLRAGWTVSAALRTPTPTLYVPPGKTYGRGT